MKDETKHFIARQLAFAVPLIAFGIFIFLPLIFTIIFYESDSNLLHLYFEIFSGLFTFEHIGLWRVALWGVALIPLIIGYIYKLFKWVMKWK